MGTLLFDIGNSRIKWAYAEGGHWPHRGVAAHAEYHVLRQALAELSPPDRILVSNVAGEQGRQAVQAACNSWRVPFEFIEAKVAQCGVRNGYDKPAQLGSDRWAALIAAWHEVHAACLVVSCGTATTVDALSMSGEFLGGLILPGLDLMRQSLKAGTAQLRETEGSWQAFPRNTADAICSGAIQATVGAIRQQHELLGVTAAPCLLSGGAADGIAEQLKLPLLRAEDLVLRGVQLIAEETKA